MRIEGNTIVEACKPIEGGYKEFSIIRTDNGSFFGVMLERHMHHMSPSSYSAFGIPGTPKTILEKFRSLDSELAAEIEFNLTWSN